MVLPAANYTSGELQSNICYIDGTITCTGNKKQQRDGPSPQEGTHILVIHTIALSFANTIKL